MAKKQKLTDERFPAWHQRNLAGLPPEAPAEDQPAPEDTPAPEPEVTPEPEPVFPAPEPDTPEPEETPGDEDQ